MAVAKRPAEFTVSLLNWSARIFFNERSNALKNAMNEMPTALHQDLFLITSSRFIGLLGNFLLTDLRK